MIGYCIRQGVRGVTNLTFASFLLFTVFMYAPFGPGAWWEECQRSGCIHREQTRLYNARNYPYLLNPWPKSYSVWLFNPNDTSYLDPHTGATVRKGIDIQIGNFHLRGSEALVGDVGQSDSIIQGLPVGHPYFIGPGILELFALFSLVTVMAMLVAIAQRWRKRNLLYPPGQPESYFQADHYFYFPASLLVGWYQRIPTSADRPIFRLY